MSVYRSGLRRFRPPLALGGHGFLCVAEELVAGDDLLSPPYDAPSIWRCLSCHVLLPNYLIREGFYPRPCMGSVAALPVGEAA